MSSTFDNKVYDIIKDGHTPEPGPDPGPDPKPEEEEEEEEEEDIPDPEIGFDDAYPVGATFTSKAFTIPLTQGTWKLVGIYGSGQKNINGADYDFIFNKQSVFVIMHAEYSKTQSVNWMVDFSSVLGSHSIEGFVGQVFRSSGYSRFYDDYIDTRSIGRWMAQDLGSNVYMVQSTGGITHNRNYELTFLVKLNNFDTVLSSFATSPLTYEFERTS